jgi:hypothetical protein
MIYCHAGTGFILAEGCNQLERKVYLMTECSLSTCNNILSNIGSIFGTIPLNLIIFIGSILAIWFSDSGIETQKIKT